VSDTPIKHGTWKDSLMNSFYKGRVERLEWNPNVFFDGTICRESDLKPVSIFTQDDAERLRLLSEGLVEPTEELETETLIFKQQMEKWEASLFEGKVTVHMRFGYVSPLHPWLDEGVLELEGDADLVQEVVDKASVHPNRRVPIAEALERGLAARTKPLTEAFNRHVQEDRFSEALEIGKEFVRAYYAVLGADHPYCGNTELGVRECLLLAGRRQEVALFAEWLVTEKKRLLGPTHPDVAIYLDSLAGDYESAGKLREAAQLREQAKAIQRKASSAA